MVRVVGRRVESLSRNYHAMKRTQSDRAKQKAKPTANGNLPAAASKAIYPGMPYAEHPLKEELDQAAADLARAYLDPNAWQRYMEGAARQEDRRAPKGDPQGTYQ